VKFRFGRREPKDIDPAMDYLMDSGVGIQLITNDPGKVKFRKWDVIRYFRVTRKKFDSLLKRDLICFVRLKDGCKYYSFRSAIKELDEIL
jgi:hypothetical protein